MKICVMEVQTLLLLVIVLAALPPRGEGMTFLMDSPPPVLLKKKTPLDKPLALPVNINSADAKTLMQVPGINRTAARQIVNRRDRDGKYTSLEQLVGFSGINASSIQRLREYLVVK